MIDVYEEEKFNREHQNDIIKAPDIGELKMTNNPCKFCNGEIDEGKPLCGDLVNDGDVVNIVKTQDGYEIELWRNFELVNSEEINFCPKCGRKLTETK